MEFMLVCISLLLLILLLFSLPLGVCWRQSFYEKTSFLSVSVSIHDRSHVHIFFYEILYRIFHPHLCLPCLCVPSMWQYNAPAGNLLSSILISWPNHVHLFLILSTSILNHSVSSLVCVCVCVYILYMYIYGIYAGLHRMACSPMTLCWWVLDACKVWENRPDRTKLLVF